MIKLLVFQHLDCEHPGSLRRFLKADGIKWDTVRFNAGDAIPPLDGYDALWVMGGPMDVWDVDEYPWLVAEKAAIRKWVVELDKPYLGLCLGHQLLADALGGTCVRQRPAEIGLYDIALTEAGRDDPLFSGTETVQTALQWHGVRVAQPPKGAIILASTDACPVQAMRVGKHVWSTQFHLEVEPDTVPNWAMMPANHEILTNTLGEDGLAEMVDNIDKNMAVFLSRAEQIYRNFMATVAG